MLSMNFFPFLYKHANSSDVPVLLSINKRSDKCNISIKIVNWLAIFRKDNLNFAYITFENVR